MSAFSDAIMQSMTASLDPMNSIVKSYAQENTEQLRISTQEAKAELIEKVSRKLTEAKASGALPSVINAYDKILSNLNK